MLPHLTELTVHCVHPNKLLPAFLHIRAIVSLTPLIRLVYKTVSCGHVMQESERVKAVVIITENSHCVLTLTII